MKPETLTRWTSENSADLFGVRNWGVGYFDVSEKGDLTIRPGGRGTEATISMMDIMDGLKARGIGMPVLLRFGDILASRIAAINGSFHKAMAESNYKGVFRGVFPIKVNQQ